MKSYIDILSNILNFGESKFPTRIVDGKIESVDEGQETLMLPNQFISHNMDNGFPLLTVRKMPFKSACVELEGFLNGITSKKWYEHRGCKFWSYWANPKTIKRICDVMDKCSEEDKKKYQLECDDLGTIYSHNLRRFGQSIDEEDSGVATGTDQLKDLVYQLKNYPSSRRMHVTYWNPLQNATAALPACHTNWTITTSGKYLNLFYSQRSADFILGHNLHSYGLLLSLLAKEGGFIPGNLSAVFVDCHLYKNQLNIAEKIIKRTPYPLPTIEIPDILSSGKPFSIFEWTHKDVKLHNYKYHPKLTCEVVV